MKSRLLSLCLLTCVLCACQTSSVTVDYDTSADFNGIKRYSWSKDSSGVEQGLDPLLEQRVKTAVRNNLASIDIAPAVAPDQPDVIVRYFVKSHIENQEPKSRGSIGIGSGGGNVGLGVGISFPLGNSKTVKKVQITVDLLNPSSDRLTWRGSNIIDIGDESAEDVTRLVNLAVAEIFKEFPTRDGE